MKIHGIELIEDGDMVINHQRRTGRPFEAESVAAWREACASRPGIALDIGAYTGLYSLLALRSGARAVVALEPHPLVRQRLHENIRVNGVAGRVAVYPCAASSVTGKASLQANPLVRLTSGAVLVSGSDVNTVTVDSIGLDYQLLAVKIDVEGHEFEVISGALTTLRRNLPLVITEALNDGAFDAQATLLEPLGYSGARADEWNVIWRPKVH